MNEFQKFVMNIRNLQAKGVKQATFDVNYLCKVLENVSPLPTAFKAKKEENIVIADGGNFGDE